MEIHINLYNFLIKILFYFSKNKIDDNNEFIASFNFTVLPPVWHYAWFWAFLFTLFTTTLLSAYLLYYILIKRPRMKVFRQVV